MLYLHHSSKLPFISSFVYFRLFSNKIFSNMFSFSTRNFIFESIWNQYPNSYLYVGSVSCTRKMSVNFFLVLPLVKILKFHANIICCLIIVIGPCLSKIFTSVYIKGTSLITTLRSYLHQRNIFIGIITVLSHSYFSTLTLHT